jgi:hypothetical protein
MDDVRQKISAFMEAITESPGLWQSVDIRVIAVPVEGVWHNLIARCWLDARRPVQVPRVRHLPQTPHLLVLQEVHPISALETLLEAISAGTLQLTGHAVRFMRRVSEAEPEEPYTSSFFSRAQELNRYSLGPRAIAHELTLVGDSARELFRVLPREREGINAMLRGLEHPWDGLDALTLYAVGYRGHVGSDHNRNVSVVAPLQASLVEPECLLDDQSLRFSVEAATPEARQATTLGLFGHDRAGHIISSTLLIGERRWRRVAEGYRYDGRFRVRNAQSITLMLRVGNQDVAQLTVASRAGENPVLLAAHQAAFPRQKAFSEILLDPLDSEGRLFERAVGRVLAYCGFEVDPFDPQYESKGVDALAYSQHYGLLLTVECTIGAINPEGKLTRLVERASAIRAAMATRARPPVVLPVVATSRKRKMLSAVERSEAEAEEIRVLCREELETLFELAMTSAPLEQAAEVIQPQPRSSWTTLTLNPRLR